LKAGCLAKLTRRRARLALGKTKSHQVREWQAWCPSESYSRVGNAWSHRRTGPVLAYIDWSFGLTAPPVPRPRTQKMRGPDWLWAESAKPLLSLWFRNGPSHSAL
jgi:hypothetical protein